MCWEKGDLNYLLILSHLQSTGHTFRENCNLHTGYNNQEIYVFLISLFKSRYSKRSIDKAYFTCLWGSRMLSFGSFFWRAPASDMPESTSCFHYFTKAMFCSFYEFTEIESVLSCFIIRKQSCCLENKSSAVVLRTPYYSYLRSTLIHKWPHAGRSRIARGPDVARGPYNAQVCHRHCPTPLILCSFYLCRS